MFSSIITMLFPLLASIGNQTLSKKAREDMTRTQASCLIAAGLVVMFSWLSLPACAQVVEPALGAAGSPAPIMMNLPLSDSGQAALAQATQSSTLPIELAPVRLPERRSGGDAFNAFRTGALYRLPGRFFLNASVENSVRLETNVFQTAQHGRTDFIYRPLPVVTAGWALTRRTRVSGQYFFLRDQYTRNSPLLNRNIQSVGMRIDQDIPITAKTTATLGFMQRTLFVTHSHWFNDLLPSISISRPVGYRGYVYGSVIQQFRWFNVFQNMQEADQFYSVGGIYRRGPWIFSSDNTFITNWRKRHVAGPNNQMFILTMEAARRVAPRLPVPIYAFVRAQPIFNIGANQALGFAGFNFRLYGGIRAEINKPTVFPVKFHRG